ncbi:MAG: DUF4339 domain-containing protein [Microthrixaceae bacterium]
MTDLPALDQPQAYVVVGPDDQRGPYTLELLVTEVVDGRLNDNTPVWWPGLADWTTMTDHGGIAAEIARRRNPSPAPEPAAFEAPAPVPPPPGPDSGGFAVDPAQTQDYSTGGYAEEPSPYAQPEPASPAYGADEVTQVAGEPVAYDAPAEVAATAAAVGDAAATDPNASQAGVFGVGGGPAGTEDAIEVPAVEVTPADFVAVDQGETGYRAAGAAEGLDPIHGMAFAELIRRSRARADAAAIVESIDVAITDAVSGAAIALGMEAVSRDDLGDRHELNYRTADGTTATVTVGRVTGHAMAVRDGHVDLDVSVTSTTYGGGVDAGTGEHGEITVRAAEYGGASIASVSLMLPLSDYVSEEVVADSDALRRDIEATVASVRARLS